MLNISYLLSVLLFNKNHRVFNGELNVIVYFNVIPLFRDFLLLWHINVNFRPGLIKDINLTTLKKPAKQSQHLRTTHNRKTDNIQIILLIILHILSGECAV